MSLKVERTSPTVLTCTRFFAAPPERVFAAHVEPKLIAQWMLGPDGWTMPECTCDARPGGAFRYVWAKGDGGGSFSITGEFHVVERPHRIVHVERMHLPDPTPDNRVDTRFEPHGTGTRMTMTMTLDEPASVDAMIASGMSDGMETSYARLEAKVLR